MSALTIDNSSSWSLVKPRVAGFRSVKCVEADVVQEQPRWTAYFSELYIPIGYQMTGNRRHAVCFASLHAYGIPSSIYWSTQQPNKVLTVLTSTAELVYCIGCVLLLVVISIPGREGYIVRRGDS